MLLYLMLFWGVLFRLLLVAAAPTSDLFDHRVVSEEQGEKHGIGLDGNERKARNSWNQASHQDPHKDSNRKGQVQTCERDQVRN